MNRQRPLSPKGVLLCGLIAAGMGLLLVLVGLGVVTPARNSMHAPLWVATGAGLAFILAGVSISIQALTGVGEHESPLPKTITWWVRLTYYLIGLVIVGALAAIGTWVAFGPGARSFSGSGMLFVPREFNDLIGRVVFGFAAILTWLCLAAFAVSGARKLFGRSKAETNQQM